MLVRIRISLGFLGSANSKSVAGVPTPIPVSSESKRKQAGALGASSRVALGILASRITGLVRERVLGSYFGVGPIADAFRASIRIPNLLSNLFGEGVLAAAFVTVYSKLLAAGEEEEAEHVAAAVFGILAGLCAILVALGVSFTPAFIDLVAAGFKGETRDLTIRLVRILFPAAGLAVMSAWCLGVLNSHRRFLLSYLAPVAMNVTILVIVIGLRHSPVPRLVIFAAWAYVAGSAMMFLVQLPRVLELLPGFRPVFDWNSPNVRSVIGNFGPVFLSRGVVQVSAYIDSYIATWLPPGAVGVLGYAQVISVLPISLFSMAISAAELPALSSAVGTDEEVAAFLRKRLIAGLRRIAFFIVPSAVAFLAIGDVLAGGLYVSGRFHQADATWVWSVLAGSAVGLLATSLGRLYSSAFYALLDTRTPLRFAIVRVALTTGLGFLFAFPLPRWLGIDPKWGVAGLTASAGIAGWVEFSLLRHALGKRIGATPLPATFTAKLWLVAFIAGAAGYGLKTVLGETHPIATAIVVVSVYGAIYFGGTVLLGIQESRSFVESAMRRFRLA
ncbi:MAG TPA: murein biosynthesis integral membrane protein MurJ [Bryobacteraceae bacterium]|nr:murein biosynthesis integral membrane protein MurJ [Bryobacteraceae bacterium]